MASNGDLDRDGDRIARTAFDRALRRYLRTNPILLYNHRYGMPMGKVTKALVTGNGLWVEAVLPKPEASTEAANIWRLVKAGVIRAFSVGAVFTRRVIGGVKTIVDADLREISIAAVGVNPATLFSLSSQIGKAFGDEPSARAGARDRAALARLTADKVELLRLRLKLLEARAR